MSRKKLFRSSVLPYHVTARVNNREDFPLPLDRVWNILAFEALLLTTLYQVEFHALVLMPNHVHILLTVPERDLGEVMNFFISSVTRTVNLRSGRSGHLFGGPYYWSVISSSRYFAHALKYVYRNPVRGGLCEAVEDHPFSTLQGLLGISHLPIPIFLTRRSLELSLPSFDTDRLLEWLNRPFPKEIEPLIQRGLRRKLFSDLRDRRTRKPIEALEQLL